MSENRTRTEGERRFEAYLNEMGYPFEFEKEYPGKQKRPDYTVTQTGVFLFDVKDAVPYIPAGKFGQYDPHEAIIHRINAGRKKFKEFKGEFPCCIVLQNNGNMHMDIETPSIVLGAMYGKVGFSVPVYVGGGPTPTPIPPIQVGFTDGAQMQPDKNTTISALISLTTVGVGRRRLRRIREDNPTLSFKDAFRLALQRFGPGFFEELHQGVIVWENAYARLPLPRDLFNGPFDERYGFDGDCITRISCGSAFAEFDQEG